MFRLPLWFKKEKVHKPWQNDFNIDYVELEDPPSRQLAYWNVPEDNFVELISVRYFYILPGFSSNHTFTLRVLRGNKVIHSVTSSLPGIVASRKYLTWSLNALNIAANWDDSEACWRLPQQWRLYPHDVLEIGAVSQGSLNMAFSEILITFKLWKTG